MTDQELNKLHEVLIMITEEIKRVCDLNGICYSLTGGSMIGAIRHKGFIPWDDDMDVAMLRSEYDKFVEACKVQLKPQFEIQTMENDENYFYGFAKIILKDTYLVQRTHENTQQKKGIYVDVFPLDNVPESESARKRQKHLNYLLIKMLSRKAKVDIEDKKSIKKQIGFHLLDCFNLFFSMHSLRYKLVNNMTKYNDQKTEYVCNMGGYYGYDRETAPREYFENTSLMKFNNAEFSVIREYDAYLTHVYGDYMKLPPEEKRHTHEFEKLDFGPY